MRLPQRVPLPQRVRVPARASRRPRRDDEPVGFPPGEPRRPWSVTVGLLLAYVEGAVFLALGARDPSGTTGEAAAAGLTFVVLGVLVLALTTLTRTGSRLARACLLLPLLAAAVVLVRERGLSVPLRVLPVLGAAGVAVTLTLLAPSRRWFGDDATRLGTP